MVNNKSELLHKLIESEDGYDIRLNTWLLFNNNVYNNETFYQFIKNLNKTIKRIANDLNMEGYIVDIKIRQKFNRKCYLNVDVSTTANIKNKINDFKSKVANFLSIYLQ